MSRVFLFGDDVDTDQIIASQYIILPSVEEMKAHAFASLDPSFADRVQPGDLLVAGENFGCGSSREQAPAVLKALGVKAVIAKSFARIFYRNAINIGLPVLVSAEAAEALADGAEAEADLTEGLVQSGGHSYLCTKLPPHMQDILQSGGLIAWLNEREG
ncbi:3-isopropylmalate dehydratase small subunit [Ruminococcaceae bacterium OttesenSCG-928-I18]|nr:3-isopropylmalate dehydratase small subunit [Ruminococcaceae bacterium OttesenSCG-928-I18]